MLCFYVWLAEREFLQEVLVIHENVKGFKAILVAFIMSKTQTVSAGTSSTSFLCVRSIAGTQVM